jgi:hypothetical protein
MDGVAMQDNISDPGAHFIVSGRYPASTGLGGALITTSASSVSVINCEIFNFAVVGNEGNNCGGMIMQGVSAPVITNNYFHDITASGDATSIEHCHGYEEFGSLNSIIKFNTFANCTGGAIDPKTGCAGQIMANNYFYNCGTNGSGNGVGAICGADGAEGDPNNPSTAYTLNNNIFDSCGSEIATDVNNVRQQNFIAFNNTIYNTQSGNINPVNLRVLSGASCQFFNNIVVTTANSSGGGGAGAGGLAFTTSGWTNVKNNCYFFNSSTSMWGQSGTNSSSLSAWQAQTGSPDVGSIASNPVFTSSITPANGTAQFKLGSGSPCIGTGSGGVNMGAWDGIQTQIGCSFAPQPVS